MKLFSITLWQLVRPHSRRLTVAIMLGIIASLCSIGLLSSSTWLITKAAQHPPIAALSLVVVAVRALGIGRGVFRYGERLLIHDVAFRVLTRLRVKIYESLAEGGPGYVSRLSRGDILTRFVTDVDCLPDAYVRVIQPYLVAVAATGAGVVITGFLMPSAVWIIVCGIAVTAVVVPLLTVRISTFVTNRLLPLRGELSALVVETLDARDELVAFDWVDEQLKLVAVQDQLMTSLARRLAALVGITSALLIGVSGISVWLMLWWSHTLTIGAGISGPEFAVVVLFPLGLYEVIALLPQAAMSWSHIAASMRRVSEVVTGAPVKEPAVMFSHRNNGDFNGPPRLCLSAVQAGWAGELPPVLDRVSIELAPGTSSVVVGKSGSGKSTLVAVLARFLDISSGGFTVGTQRAADIDDDDVRSLIGFVLHDMYVFPTTLRENLLIARRDATDEHLWQCVELAQLSEWVRDLPEGLDTVIGEWGRPISAGQRQRLALARAFVADRPYLVLDEPTAHLNAGLAHRVSQAVRSWVEMAPERRTVLIITHQLAEWNWINRVYRLDKGVLVSQAAVTSRA